jgi:fibronectin type 3 domain-containing protein
MKSVHSLRMRSCLVDRLLSKPARILSGLALLTSLPLHAHPISLNSSITYSVTQPSGASGSVAQWSGAAFDAANIGGSGVNADGGADNGTANDASTRVSRPTTQGQTFTTGSNANGYEVSGITVRVAGYTNNTATGANQTSWDLAPQIGPIVVAVGKVNGTAHSLLSIQNFMAGGEGHSGVGSSVNGPGTYLTFNLPFPVHLDPNTIYSFDFSIGHGTTAFELLGTSTDPYAGGTAYTRTGGASTITPLSGDRVFQVNMTAATTPYAPFTHPGALHTQADFDRMKDKIDAGAEPWKTSYDSLAASVYAQTNWSPGPVEYIIRGGSEPNNYIRSQTDAQALYHLSLRWKLTGDVAYANTAVAIANAWSGRLLGVGGDVNGALASGICGYLFATGGEILSTYPGWPEAEKQAYKDMMMRVFYTGNEWFLWNHFYTPDTKGGNTTFRQTWDTDAMAAIAAIGILCDNRAVYQQAVDYFKNAPGNGRVERAAWYIHPDGTAQTEESGRDQPHNRAGWYAMALLCQMAWNQGDDLFGYDNNRVLRAYEYNAKYNNGVDVPWVYHRNTDLSYTEGLSDSGRWPGAYPCYELIYNHYANVKGIAAPWNKIGMNAIRPEPATGANVHPSALDHLGLGSLTYARDNTSSAAPSGLLAQWSKNQLVLNWWGSATATSYEIQRTASGASISGPYTLLGTASELNLNFTDTTVANGASYYYKVVAVTPTGNLESTPLLANQALVASYTFEGNTNDGTGTRHGTPKGTTLPGYAAGFGGGQALSLNGTDQYVQLPVNSGLSRDITLSAWVYWNGGNAFQRVFDFGSEIEKFMMLTVKGGNGNIVFQMTTSRVTDGTITLVGPTMPTTIWTHLSVTFNGETATLYVNGLPVAAGSSPRLAPMFSQPFCYLGRSMWNGDAYFNGRIDNFRIYNYGLTGKEVYALWGQGGANAAPVFTANPMTKPAGTQGVAYPAGQSIAATDANGGTLTYSKASGPAWLTVASNGELSGTPTNADVGKNLSVVRVTDASGATDDANLYITVANVNDAPTWNTPSLTKLTVSVGQTYPTVSLAADASDVDSPYGDTFTFSKVSGPAWLIVASDGTLSGVPTATDGGVNTFTVRVTDISGASSNVTLTITVLPASLRSHYDFESNANDDLGNFHGTVTGTATYAAGRYGNGLVFDGSSTYVTLPANAVDYQDITVAAWVNWNGSGNFQRIFDFGNNTNQYLLLTPNSGGFRFAIKNGGAEEAVTAPALTAGQWAHVAVTLKGGTATLYLNGVPVGVNNAITISPADFKPAFNYIGKSQFNDPLFNGTIDSFRIYNHALDAAAIQTIAADGITHLKFNESSGTTAADATGSGWDGTLATGATWSASGKLSGAVDLNGTGGHLSLPSGIVNGVSTATIATWVNLDAVGNWQRVFDFGTGTTVNMFLTPKNGTLMRFGITTSGSAGEQRIDSSAGALTTGWHHVAVVLNGSSGTLYLDGVQVGQNTAMTLNPNSLGNTTLNYLGKSQYNDPYLDGRLDDFRIFERALTAAEVSVLAGTMAAPGSPAITAGNTQAGLTWTAVSGATRHLVKRSTTSGGPYTTLVGSVTGTSFTDTGLANGTTYYYVVAGVNSLGEGLPTAQLTATPLATTPAAPGGVAANGWNGNVQVSWNASVGAVSYNVLRSTTSGSGYASIASGVTTTSHTDTTAADGITYYYVVTATNSGGTSANSSQASALTTKPRVSLAFDDGTSPTADASGNGWNGTLVNGPLWTAGRAGSAVWFDGGNDHVTLPTGVVNGVTATTITFWADLDSASNWTRFFDFGTGTTANMFLTPKNGANEAIRFAITTSGGAGEQKIDGTATFPVTGWHHVAVTLAGATGTLYVDGVQVGQNTAMTLTPSSLGATTLNRIGRSQYNDPYLAGRVDEFRVYNRAFSAAEVASVMAGGPSGLPAPTGVTASSAVGQITVNWTAVTGATGYEVLRSTTSGGPYMTVASNVSGTSNTNAALPAATTYYYVVVAHNATSESMNSAEASASTP